MNLLQGALELSWAVFLALGVLLLALVLAVAIGAASAWLVTLLNGNRLPARRGAAGAPSAQESHHHGD